MFGHVLLEDALHFKACVTVDAGKTTPSLWLYMWRMRLPFSVRDSSQLLQEKGRSPVRVRIWYMRPYFCEKEALQCLEKNQCSSLWVGAAHVISEAVLQRKGLVAVGAGKRPFSCVGAHVVQEVGLVREGLTAVAAWKGTLSRVSPYVLCEVGVLNKGHVAVGAGKGPLSRVDAHMLFQAAFP